LRVAARRGGLARTPAITPGRTQILWRAPAHGWKVMRLDAELTLHEEAMTVSSRVARKCARATLRRGAIAPPRTEPERTWAARVSSKGLWGLVFPRARPGARRGA